MRLALNSPPWLAAAVIAAAGACLWPLFYGGARRLPASIKIARAVCCCLVSLMAVSPVMVIVEQVVKKPQVAVLVDFSAYMNGTLSGGSSKLESSLKFARVAATDISEFADVSLFGYDGTIFTIDASSGSRSGAVQSDIAKSLGELARYEPGRFNRALVVTDGISESSRGRFGNSGNFGMPADFVVAGEMRRKSIAFEELNYSDFAYVHLPCVIGFKLSAAGFKGKSFPVRLTENGKELAAAQLRPDRDDFVYESTFSFPAVYPGPIKLTLQAGAGADAVSRELNVRVIHDKLRILYLCGKPSYEYSLLRDFIKSDPNKELVTFVILRNPENRVPVSEDQLSLIPFPAQQLFSGDLSLFDAVILENFSFRRLYLGPEYAAMLAGYVKNGGGLIVMGDNAGGFAEEIDGLLPMEPDRKTGYSNAVARFVMGKHPVSAVAGEDSEYVWERAPLQDGFAMFGGLKPGAREVLSVKAGAGALPFCGAWQHGKGRVMAMGAVSTWRWKMLPDPLTRQAGLYAAFWSRTIDYLSGRMELDHLSVSAEPSPAEGGSAVITAAVLDSAFMPAKVDEAVVSGYVAGPDGRAVPLLFAWIAPGIYKAKLENARQGRFKIQVKAQAGRELLAQKNLVFNAVSPDAGVSDYPFVQRLAGLSGGKAWRLGEFNAAQWARGLSAAETVEETRTNVEMFGSVIWLFIAIFAAAAEWCLRRKHGLL